MSAEILAPAGAMEQVLAAVRCGADAVYLGAGAFNARRNAVNFDEFTLPQAVSYCHGRGVRVYVTVNTLVRDDEFSALEQTAAEVAASGADAVIIQDPAVLDLFRRNYPTIECYSSTQTVVHNVEGALALREMGYHSIMLARELTLQEMSDIAAAVPDLKLEAFVHGAHCMSVSGACYLSGMLGGRSGNRGLCAQPCRLDWHCGKKEYALSLKDMSLISHVREMEQAGVASFKIEGRMKRPEYVAAAVTACRAALDGREYDEEQLRAVFSRSGFTDGYLTGRRDASMFGSRTKEDVTGASGVLKELQNLYKAETPQVPVDLSFRADAAGSSLTVSDGSHTITITGDVPEAARTRPMDEAAAQKNLGKTGGTPFYVNHFSADIAPDLMLSTASLNALRREALEKLLHQRETVIPHEYHAAEPEPLPEHRTGVPRMWARFYSPEQIPAGEEYDRIILPAFAVTPELIARFGEHLTAELPAVLFPEDEPRFEEKLRALKDEGLMGVLTDNIYGLRLAKRLDLQVWGGAGLNVLNSRSLAEYARQGVEGQVLSYELAISAARKLKGELSRGIVAYGSLPLMRWRNCPVKASIGCAACCGKGTLTDRYGITFPVECTGKKYSTLLNSVPLHIADRDLSGFDFLLLYFTREDAAACARITQDYRLGRKTRENHTGGLYYRELL